MKALINLFKEKETQQCSVTPTEMMAKKWAIEKVLDYADNPKDILDPVKRRAILQTAEELTAYLVRRTWM